MMMVIGDLGKKISLLIYAGLNLWICSNTFSVLRKFFNIVWTSNLCYNYLVQKQQSMNAENGA